MEGWSREILTFRSSSPNSPLQNAWKGRFRMSRRQNPPGGKCSSWLILRATLLPDFRCETSVVHLRQSTRIRPVAQTPAWNQEVAAYESHSDPFAARDAQMRDAQ